MVVLLTIRPALSLKEVLGSKLLIAIGTIAIIIIITAIIIIPLSKNVLGADGVYHQIIAIPGSGHLVAMGAGKVLWVPGVPKGCDHLTHDRFAAMIMIRRLMMRMMMMTMLLVMMLMCAQGP